MGAWRRGPDLSPAVSRTTCCPPALRELLVPSLGTLKVEEQVNVAVAVTLLGKCRDSLPVMLTAGPVLGCIQREGRGPRGWFKGQGQGEPQSVQQGLGLGPPLGSRLICRAGHGRGAACNGSVWLLVGTRGEPALTPPHDSPGLVPASHPEAQSGRVSAVLYTADWLAIVMLITAFS